VLASVVDRLGELDSWLLLLAVFLLSAGESAIMLDLVVPGEVAMVVAGAVVADTGGPVAATMACAAAGALVGDSISYALGATVGTRAVDRWPWARRRLCPSTRRARRYFEHRGGVVVFVGRWVGALRAVVPFVAEAGRMGYQRFLAWDVPAAITWGVAVVGLGAAFGDDVVDLVEALDWWATVVVAVSVVAWLGFRLARRRAERATAEPSR
jgi:undecaprenyl-diphosphatase